MIFKYYSCSDEVICFTGYPDFGQYLNETGRPMVYSCSWPVYQEFAGIEVCPPECK